MEVILAYQQTLFSFFLCPFYSFVISLFVFIYMMMPLLFFIIIYFWLRWVFVAVCGLSLVAASRGYCSLRFAGFSLWWFSCCGAQALGAWASVVCGVRPQQLWLAGSRAQAQQLWHTGFIALRHVGSSRTRDRTCVPALAGGFLTTAPPGKSAEGGQVRTSELKKFRCKLVSS